MKTIARSRLKLLVCCVVALCAFGFTMAQTSGHAKREAKRRAELKNTIDSARYLFTASSANPMRGPSRELNSDYDLKITKDTLVAYLPYFGQAFMAPIDPSQGGIKFTSIKFDYQMTEVDNGGWQIAIKPKDAQNVEQLNLTISVDGYANLTITFLDKDPITFAGYISKLKKQGE